MTYHTQRSIIQSPTSVALSDYSILLYLPFCRILFSFPLLQPSALSPHAPAPDFLFLVLCRLSFRANQNEQNSWGHWKVAGTHVSWHIFTLVWCPLSLRWHVNNLEKRTTEWFQYTSHDCFFFFLHMCTLVRMPALDSRYDFSPHLPLNGWKHWWKIPLLHFSDYTGQSEELCLFGQMQFAAVSAGFFFFFFFNLFHHFQRRINDKTMSGWRCKEDN